MTGEAGAVWVGVDIGTQGARVLAVTDAGEVVGRGSHPLASVRTGKRHEQDPRAWLTAVTTAARAALRDLPATAVGGLAVCATSGTFVVTDAAGRPRTPGLMYDDARAAGTAGPPGVPPTWPLAKLAWLRHHQPAVLRGRARLAHQADLVAAHLTGHPVAADSSHALKTGYDPLSGSWPAGLTGLIGVPGSLLPPVVPPAALLGHVGAAAAAATGLPTGAPVFAGMTDGCASQIAAGALRVGDWNSVLGTTLVVKGVSTRPVRDDRSAVYSHLGPDGDWLPGGASSTGAGALAAAFPGADLGALDRAAAAREPARVPAYPLRGRGERFPLAAPGAHALMLGRPSDDLERYAAILQGVAYVERLALASMSYLGAPAPAAVSFTGGGSRSGYWNQVRSDVLGLPARVPTVPEAAFGMAVLAAYAAGRGTRLAEVASRMVTIREVIEPRDARTRWFTGQYHALLDELERRGWLPGAVAAFARARP